MKPEAPHPGCEDPEGRQNRKALCTRRDLVGPCPVDTDALQQATWSLTIASQTLACSPDGGDGRRKAPRHLHRAPRLQSPPPVRTPMPRLHPAPQPAQAIACGIPEQCSRGGPATTAVGYYSVLCCNSTVTLPQLLTTLPHYSTAGWACLQCEHTEHGACTVRHQPTRPTSDVQQPSCRRCDR